MGLIKTVLFDLGGVLVHIDPGAFWRKLGLSLPLDIAPFATGYDFWVRQYEMGSIKTPDFLKELCAVFNDQYTIDQLEQAFAGIIQKPMVGMTELVSHVSSGYQTALVSNTNETHYRVSCRCCESLQFLSKHYLSYQLREMKPDARFYRAIIEDQKVNSAAIVFIDDTSANIEGARSAGMQAIHFQDIERLKVSLRKLNIL